MVFIVGKSGSGKSTLLNMISGFDKPTEGEIFLEDKDIIKLSKKEMDNYRAECLGFIFQDYYLIDNLNVSENIRIALSIIGTEDDELVREALETVSLSGYENRKVNELSGGECQRVAIARALVKDPNIILADEPTGNLDSRTSAQVLRTLKRISADHLVLIVSHNLDDAYTYGDQIIELKDGRIISEKEKIDGYKNEFVIENETAYLPYRKELAIAQVDAVNDGIEKGSLKKIAQLTDGFEHKEIRKAPPKSFEFSNKKLLPKESLRLTLRLLKKHATVALATVILTSLLITLFGLLQSFVNYKSTDTMDSALSEITDQSIILHKGHFSEDTKILDKKYIVHMSEDDIAKIRNSEYQGNIYTLYSYALNIINKFGDGGEIRFSNMPDPLRNYEQFYAMESIGVLVTDEEYLTRLFGVSGELKVLAGDIHGDVGLIITDYIADSMLYYQKDIVSDYEDLIGPYHRNGCNRTYIKAIIETGYEEKYENVKKSIFAEPDPQNPFSKMELYKSDEWKDFYVFANRFLGVAYSFDENFIDVLVNTGYKQYVSFANLCISYNGYFHEKNITSTANIDESLQGNEMSFRYDRYNQLFGTSYNNSNYKKDFVSHKALFEKFDPYYLDNPTPLISEEVTIKCLYSGGTDSIRCSSELLREFVKIEVQPYALYLDNNETVSLISDVIKDNDFYINIDSYVLADNVSNIISNFDELFEFLLRIVLVIAVVTVAYFSYLMVSKNKKFIGITKSLGLKSRDLRRIFAGELALMGVCIAVLSVILYFAFTNIGNELFIKVFTAIFDNEMIATFTFLKPDVAIIALDLGIIFAIFTLGIAVLMAYLKRFEVITIIKSND